MFSKDHGNAETCHTKLEEGEALFVEVNKQNTLDDI
jgi:hypothetical protein